MKPTIPALSRGHRLRSPSIPPNMRARMAEAEARAWAHSPAAGALWESGLRLSLAIRLAEKIKCCADEKTVIDSSRASERHAGPADPGNHRTTEKMKNIITDSISITNIRESETSSGAFEASWDSTTSEGANEAIEAALEANGFELDSVAGISGLFDERGRDAMSMEVSHGTVHFRPRRK